MPATGASAPGPAATSARVSAPVRSPRPSAAIASVAGRPAGLVPAASDPVAARGLDYLTAPANLIDGHYYEVFAGSGFADYGLTLDGAFALAANGSRPAALSRIAEFVDHRGKDASGRSIDDWTGIGTPYVSGGSIAKQALLAEVTGYDPSHFGGQDLITALRSTICTQASTGTDTSCAASGNYAYANSVFAQAIGVIAQLRAGDGAHASTPMGYLTSLQHPDGSFPSLIPASGNSDVDSTAMAAMALNLLPGNSTAVGKALTWLASQQLPDGGFPGAAGDSTNSAGLAVQALTLAATSYTAPLAKALAFLSSQQNTDGGFTVGAGQSGSDVRASAQAVGALIGTSFGVLADDVRTLPAAAAGAQYLLRQLVNGDHLVNAFGPDYGLTADLAIALAAADGPSPALAKVVGYLRAHVVDYADPAGTTGFPGPYSGAIGKLALVAEIAGQDPHSFGGFDLLGALESHVCPAADTAGACSAAGDFYQSFSTVSQTLAVLALARGGSTVPAAAMTRLLQLQCADGGFTSPLLAPGDTCASEPDTTSYAIQALSLVPGQAAALTRATDYLRTTQQTDGGFNGASGENTNSTGLAAQALLTVNATGAIGRARTFLLGRQNLDGGFGIKAAAPASDTRSTTQAVPALAGASLTSLSAAVVPVTPVTPSHTPAPSPSASSVTSSLGSAESAAASGSSSIGGISASRSPEALAVTGSADLRLLWWALLLLVAGLASIGVGLVRRPEPATTIGTGRRH